MRKLLLKTITLLSMCTQLVMANDIGKEYQPYHYVINKDIYKLAEFYQINPMLNETYTGSIKKSAFRIRSNYDLSNSDGWQATGITRVMSLGVIYNWAKDIDIYDTRGVKIGLIYGNIATMEAAKFDIYQYNDDGKSNKIGFAYANPDFTRFVILKSLHDPRPIAEMHRNLHDNNWDVSVYEPDIIDSRIMRIFSGFVIDHENKFLSNTK